METVGAFEVKTHLAELLRRVEGGESFTIPSDQGIALHSPRGAQHSRFVPQRPYGRSPISSRDPATRAK